jgi:hypothetical protein
MCDLHWQHLAIYFYMLCVYVCCLYKYNVAAKSWLAPGCNWEPGCPFGGASNKRCASNRVCFLLVLQWHQLPIKSAAHALITCLGLISIGRHAVTRTCLKCILIRDVPWAHISDYFVMRDAVMEMHDLSISILHAGMSRFCLSDIVMEKLQRGWKKE